MTFLPGFLAAVTLGVLRLIGTCDRVCETVDQLGVALFGSAEL